MKIKSLTARKIITSLFLIYSMFVSIALAESDVEIPVHQLVSVKYNDTMQSSDPEVMMRQFEYMSSATPDALLQFYRDSAFVKSCEKNDMADNFMCALAEHGKVHTGHVFISTKTVDDQTAVFADYFYNQ